MPQTVSQSAGRGTFSQFWGPDVRDRGVSRASSSRMPCEDTVPRLCPASRGGGPSKSHGTHVAHGGCGSLVVRAAVTPLGLACRTPRPNAPPTQRHLLQVDMHSQPRAMSLLAFPGFGGWEGGWTHEVPFTSPPLSPWEPLPGFLAKAQVPPSGSTCLRWCVLGSRDTWAPAGPASLGPRWTVSAQAGVSTAGLWVLYPTVP